MLALSPPTFSSMGWFTEDPSPSHQHNNINMYIETKGLESTSFCGNGTNPKKLNHNASERYRRRKMNTLYSDLQSLLPDADQTKKLSIPKTVSCVLRYIPELQKEVERLVQTKKELLSTKSKRLGDFVYDESLRDGLAQSSSRSNVFVRIVGDGEVLVQISSVEQYERISLSEVLEELEENHDMVLLNASCFKSASMIFYSLHFQVQGNPSEMELTILKKRVMLLLERTN